MLLTPTSEKSASPAATDPVPGATIVIEAATAEEALAQVHERLGPDARILDAGRIRRGGIAGFFAREIVQMHAAPADTPTAQQPTPAWGAGTAEDATAPSAAPTAPTAPTAPAAQAAATAPIDRLLAEARTTSEATDFATFLREQIGHGEADGDGLLTASAPSSSPFTAASPFDAATPFDTASSEFFAAPDVTPAPVGFGHGEPVEPVVWPSAAGDDVESVAAGAPFEEPTVTVLIDEGGPAWSPTALIRLGLPPELVRSIQVAEPGDDVAWTYGLASALRPLCRPLPVGRSLLVGPCARGLANKLGVTVVGVGDPLRSRGDIATAVGGGPSGRDWIERAGRNRWLHLVAGGNRWRELLDIDPLAISWAKAEDLADAVRCSYELGLVLGHGPLGDAVHRARPLDVALAIRELVPQR